MLVVRNIVRGKQIARRTRLTVRRQKSIREANVRIALREQISPRPLRLFQLGHGVCNFWTRSSMADCRVP